MRKILVPVLILLVVAGAASLLWTLVKPTYVFQTEILETYIVRDELRLLVETSRSHLPLVAHGMMTDDFREYYVAIDLTSRASLSQRSRVIGPLTHVHGQRSNESFDIDGNFNRKGNAAPESQWFRFNEDGELLRLLRDSDRQVTLRDVLKVESLGPFWKQLGNRKDFLQGPRPGSENRLASRSRQFVLLFRNDEAEMFNILSGERVEDPWLTKCFAHVRSIEYLTNVRFHLTDDLNYLVVCPEAVWNDGNTLHKTFQLDGVIYNRTAVVLIYGRPQPAPQVVQRDPNEGDWGLPPMDAFAIDNELYFLDDEGTSMRLYTPDGKKQFLVDLTGVRKDRSPHIQHLPELSELLVIDDLDSHGNVEVLRWNYRTDELSQDRIPLNDLFELRGDHMLPKSAEAIK